MVEQGLSVRRSVGLSVWRSAGVPVYRSAGRLVCRSSGLPVYRSAGLPVCRSAGLLDCWSAGLPVCRFVGFRVSGSRARIISGPEACGARAGDKRIAATQDLWPANTRYAGPGGGDRRGGGIAQKLTTPGVELGLSRPRRDVLATRRCGPRASICRNVIQARCRRLCAGLGPTADMSCQLLRFGDHVEAIGCSRAPSAQ